MAEKKTYYKQVKYRGYNIIFDVPKWRGGLEVRAYARRTLGGKPVWIGLGDTKAVAARKAKATIDKWYKALGY